MLRKRTRSYQKDQVMSESLDSQSDYLGLNKHKANPNPLFTVPGLFIGRSNKGLSDSDSVRSPTSPLEFRVCSNTTEPFIRPPRSPQNGHQLNLGPTKIGLSIVDSLDDDINLSGEIIFGPSMRIKSPKNQITHIEFFQEPESPKSLPKDYLVSRQTHIKNHMGNGKSGIVFEIGENASENEPFGIKNRYSSLDSCWSYSTTTSLAHCKTNSNSGHMCLKNIASKVCSPTEFPRESPYSNKCSDTILKSVSGSIGSSDGYIESQSASELELSEDYTCVISRGPNPKTTHLYGDRVLECHRNKCSRNSTNEGQQIAIAPPVPEPVMVFPSDNFLSFCYFCNNKLEEGKDIYMYSEKAFCNLDCRSREILIQEEAEEAMDKSPKNLEKPDNTQEVFRTGIAFTT